MADEPAPDQSYGQALPDQVKRIANLFDAHLELIGDVRELYQSRALIEREYAEKLQTLAKRAADKKTKMEARFVVGEDPTKSLDAHTLLQNTLHSAYDALINSLTDMTQDHLTVADTLSSQVVEVLRVVERRNEDARKKEFQFYQKLLADRDRIYADRIKSKQKYDTDCDEVESFRQKQTRAQDEKHKKHAAKQAEQQRNDMFNSKNTYLISTAIANQIQDKFYSKDLPDVQNEFQRLQKRLVERFMKVLVHGQQLQLDHLDRLRERIKGVESKLTQVQPLRDQALFIEHNIRPFNVPSGWKFEPCPSHYDTDNINTDATPKIVLQNKLSRCRSSLQELGPVIDSKRSEYSQLSNNLQGHSVDHSIGNIDDLVDNYLDAQHQLTFYDRSRFVLQAEIETIAAAIGDDEGTRSPHAFKSSSFSIPTQCSYCESSIWGLGKQGKTCKLCGLSVHTRCELKVPANCPAGDQSGGTLSRKTTSSSRTGVAASSTAIPTPSSFVRPQTPEDAEEDLYPERKVLFDYAPSSEFELGVHEGMTVQVMEPDDGSGWVKVADSRGKSGLVPASYIGSDDNNPNEGGLALPGGSQRVKAIYPYQSQGPDELGLKEGEILELSLGGQDYGNGWWEGFNSKGQKGIFPSNYVEIL